MNYLINEHNPQSSDDIAIDLQFVNLERSISNPRQCRKNELLLILADMGLNTFVADQLIEIENINIYDPPLFEVVDLLIERIIQREQELASLELLGRESNYEINVEIGDSNIQINSFQQYSKKDKQGPKLSISHSSQQRQEEEESEPKFQCFICLDDKTLQEMQSDVLKPCPDHRFCSDCIHSFLTNCIKNSKVEQILCPYEGCLSQYTDLYICSQVTEQEYNNYKRFQHIMEVSKDPNVRWCPKVGCQLYAVGPPLNRDSQIFCPCSQAICFDCRHEFHGQQSCEMALGVLYRQALKKYIIQGCPKCKVPIQKESGCNHMTCYNCRYQFCWLCRRKYQTKHYKRLYLNGCHGGQFSSQKPAKYPRLILGMLALPRSIYWIMFLIWIIIKSLVKLVLFSIFVGVSLPLYVASNYTVKLSQILKQRQNKPAFYSLSIFLIILGIILFPLNIALAICPGLCIVIRRRLLLG